MLRRTGSSQAPIIARDLRSDVMIEITPPALVHVRHGAPRVPVPIYGRYNPQLWFQPQQLPPPEPKTLPCYRPFLAQVFSYLPPQDLARLEAVSKVWQRESRDPSVWRALKAYAGVHPLALESWQDFRANGLTAWPFTFRALWDDRCRIAKLVAANAACFLSLYMGLAAALGMFHEPAFVDDRGGSGYQLCWDDALQVTDQSCEAWLNTQAALLITGILGGFFLVPFVFPAIELFLIYRWRKRRRVRPRHVFREREAAHRSFVASHALSRQLRDAVRRADVESIKFLLSIGANSVRHHALEESVAEIAAYRQMPAILRLLLQSGRVDVDDTKLVQAVEQQRDPQVVITLLQNGTRRKSRWVRYAIRHNAPGVLRALFASVSRERAGALSNTFYNISQPQPVKVLLMATAKRQGENVRLLVEHGADVSAKSGAARESALLCAARIDLEWVCDALIKEGADGEESSAEGITATEYRRRNATYRSD